MNGATAWPGFAPVTDSRQIARQTAQLEDHFGDVTFEAGERLTDHQQSEYRTLALEQAARHDRHAQAHQRYADGHHDRAERLAEEARPVETAIVFGALGAELVERKAPAAPLAEARISLAEAAQRLGVTTTDAVTYLGLAGHFATADGTFRTADVDHVKDAR